VEMIVDYIRTLLGQEPCHFAFLSLGSLSREEICPYSDLECAIVFEGDKEKEISETYFKYLSKQFELIVINLGETNFKLGDPEKRWL